MGAKFALHVEVEVPAIAYDGDQALFIRPEDGCVSFLQRTNDQRVWMAVAVVEPGRDDPECRALQIEKLRRARGPAAVMAYLDYIVMFEQAGLRKFALDLLFHVAG